MIVELTVLGMRSDGILKIGYNPQTSGGFNGDW
jgi:hypothetical protein